MRNVETAKELPPIPVKAPDPQVQALLDRLDRQSRDAALDAAGPQQKRERRWPFRKAALGVVIDHPGGGSARVPAHSHSLWCEGIKFLSAGFSYPGSACFLTLVKVGGEVQRVAGVIASCQHAEGAWHVTEVRFNQRIDPHAFIEAQRGAVCGGESEAVDLLTLHGRILYLDDSELDRRLLAHYFRGSSIELKATSEPDEALRILAGSMIDIFLCDLNLREGSSGVDVVRLARDANFTGPIVILTAENSPSKLATAKAAGADQFISKPYQRQAMMQLIYKLHVQVGAITSGETLYSSLDEQPEMEELIAGYVAEVKSLAERIQAGIISQDFDAVRNLCLSIKGTAMGYGFAALGKAAEEAIRGLDSCMCVAEARPQLRMLLLTCGQVGLRATRKEAAAIGHR